MEIIEDSDTTFIEVMKKIKNFRDDREWKQFHTPKNLSMAIATEAGELMEHFLWDTQEQARDKVKAENKLAEVRDELADVMIFSFLMVDLLDEDVANIMMNKLKKNKEKYPEEKAKGKSERYTDL